MTKISLGGQLSSSLYLENFRLGGKEGGEEGAFTTHSNERDEEWEEKKVVISNDQSQVLC